MPKNQRIYTEKDYVAAGRTDRIIMSMMEPERFVLSEKEDAYRSKLARAYAEVFEEYRQGEAVRWIQENIEDCETWFKANKVYADMCAVFGRFLEKNKAMQRAIIAERFYYFAKMAEADENWELAAKMLDKAAQIEGLYEIEGELNPADFLLPAPVITNDPRVLRLRDVEDARFEDE